MSIHVQTPRTNILNVPEIQYVHIDKILLSEPLSRKQKRSPLPGILGQSYAHHGPKQPFTVNNYDQFWRRNVTTHVCLLSSGPDVAPAST